MANELPVITSAFGFSKPITLPRMILNSRTSVWTPFELRGRVLDHFGYIDEATETVTPSGKWLADLPVDRPLLAGETLREGICDALGTAEAAPDGISRVRIETRR